MKFAVVDIETTGAFSHYNGITEVAVVLTDGKKILNSYETLLKPDQSVPGFITALTGIDNGMLEDAPTFAEVAEELLAAIDKDAIFVAHNVGFDYGFLRKAFQHHGHHFYRKKICSVRMAKSVFPDLHGYALTKLSHYFGIEHVHRHRAMGDAMATYELLKILLDKDQEDYVEKALKGQSLERRLPPHLPRTVFENIPEETGVYHFHNQTGSILYTGKANNLRQRIVTHLNSKTPKQQILQREVHNITFEHTGSSLIAELLESERIKENYPPLNSAQKRSSSNYGIISYTDHQGYLRLAISKHCAKLKPLAWFNNLISARNCLMDLIDAYDLCPKLCSLHKSASACYAYQNETCDGACIGEVKHKKYNQRMKRAIKELQQENLNLLIFDKGRTFAEKSVVAIKNGKYLGFGYLPKGRKIKRMQTAMKYIDRRKDNSDIQRILNSYLAKGKLQVVVC